MDGWKVPILKAKGRRGQENCSEKLVQATKKEKLVPPLAFCLATVFAGLPPDYCREEQETGIGEKRARSLRQNFYREYETASHP